MVIGWLTKLRPHVATTIVLRSFIDHLLISPGCYNHDSRQRCIHVHATSYNQPLHGANAAHMCQIQLQLSMLGVQCIWMLWKGWFQQFTRQETCAGPLEHRYHKQRVLHAQSDSIAYPMIMIDNLLVGWKWQPNLKMLFPETLVTSNFQNLPTCV